MLVGYARVSTYDQDLTLQDHALREAGCKEVFVETASGAQRDRPELKRALEFLREGDVLVVWKLDRLARSLKQLIETVDELEGRKIAFKSLTDDIDTSSPAGKLIFHIFGALSEFERSLIIERTKAGLAAARKRGKVGGRPRSLSDEDLDVAKALMSDGKLTIAQIASRLEVSSATLYRYLPSARAASEGRH